MNEVTETESQLLDPQAGYPYGSTRSYWKGLFEDKQCLFELSIVLALLAVGLIEVFIAQDAGRIHIANWSAFVVYILTFALFTQVINRHTARLRLASQLSNTKPPVIPEDCVALKETLTALTENQRKMVKVARSNMEGAYLRPVAVLMAASSPMVKEVVPGLHLTKAQGVIILLIMAVCLGVGSQVLARRRFQREYKGTIATLALLEESIATPDIAIRMKPELIESLNRKFEGIRTKGTDGLKGI